MGTEHYAILLLILALGLMIAEIFIPSGGMILVMALVSLVGSILCAWNAWWDESTRTYFWVYIGSLIFLIPTTIGTFLYIFPRTNYGKRILLEAPDKDEVTAYAEEARKLASLVGEIGETLTLLNPGGMVLVDNRRMHCESEGVLIEARTEVDIIGVKSNRLVVKVTQGRSRDPLAMDPSPEVPQSGSDVEETQKDGFDFQIPNS